MLLFLLFSIPSFAQPSSNVFKTFNGIPYIALDSNVQMALGLQIVPIDNALEMNFSTTHTPAPYAVELFQTLPMPFLLKVSIQGKEIDTHQAPIMLYQGTLYLPYTSEIYNTLFERSQRTFTFKNLATFHESLPLKYSTFEQAPIDFFIRNQGAANTCWAYAANTMFELFINKTTNLLEAFSVEHMIENAPIPSTLFSGGNFNNANTYYLNGLGPQSSLKSSSTHYELAGYHSYNTLPQIKNHILQYGSVLTSIYFDPLTEAYYNRETNTYYNANKLNPITHDVLLVGWDDTFDKNAFLPPAKHNGAYIGLNSFGSNWGENGLFYISYDDVHASSNATGITKIHEKSNNESRYYLNDKGITHFESFMDSQKTVGRIIFQNNTDNGQWLSAVGVYTGNPNTHVDLYATIENLETRPMSENDRILSLNLSLPGFERIELSKPLFIPAGASYTLTAVYKSAYPYQMPIQADYPGIYYDLYAKPNQSFIGSMEPSWNLVDMSQYRKNGVIALRAYTQNKP